MMTKDRVLMRSKFLSICAKTKNEALKKKASKPAQKHVSAKNKTTKNIAMVKQSQILRWNNPVSQKL